jgi:hypothetical protein
VRGQRTYRALLRLYPQWFRDEYGPDMELLFATQLRDERPLQVWVRAVWELARTVPARHLESRGTRSRVDRGALLMIWGGVMMWVASGLLGGPDAVARSVPTVAAVAIARTRERRGWHAGWALLVGGLALVSAVLAWVQVPGPMPAPRWVLAVVALCVGASAVATWLLVRAAHRSARRGEA